MLEHTDFITAVWAATRRVGMKPTLVAQKIIRDYFPETDRASHDEGADAMFRSGVIEAVRKMLKGKAPDMRQGDLSSVHASFATLASKLNHQAYYVESLDEFVPVSDLIRDPALLDDARKYMRRKGMETLAEADRLDELYAEVVAVSQA